MMELLSTENLVAFLTLLALEIVLGIDNVIFIAILSGKLPRERQALARRLGISLAVISRLLLLLGITWIMRLEEPLFTVLGHALSGRDLILLVGGIFLIGKSTFEIHDKLEADDKQHESGAGRMTLATVVIQVMVIDVVFSLDSVITAVGLSGKLEIMIPAVVIAAGVMLFASGMISRFIERHPTMKMLALSFLILIGALLLIEGWNPEACHELHLRNYAYFAMFFSFAMELLNMRIRDRAEKPVRFHNRPKID
ncbi:MAG: TerC family protein [Planctomycetota bacterium]